jgi:uncharacterized membrane protein
MTTSQGSAGKGSAIRQTAARRGSRLRFPTLFFLIALLFVIDLVVPDFIPFVDEIILGLLTVVLGLLRERRGHDEPVEKAERVDPGP